MIIVPLFIFYVTIANVCKFYKQSYLKIIVKLAAINV